MKSNRDFQNGNPLLNLIWHDPKSLLIKQMTGTEMPVSYILVLWSDFLADLHAMLTSCMELASLWRIGRRRNITLKHDTVHMIVGIRNRNS